MRDSFVKELRLHGISTIEGANLFLKDIFIPWFNSRFAVEPRSTTDMHRMIPDTQKESGLFGRKVTQALFREVELPSLREAVALPMEE